MGFMISDTDYANLRGAYPYLNLDPLTTQEEQFLLQHFRGLSVPVAARAAGMTERTGYALIRREGMDKLIEYLKQQMFGDIQITLESLNDMALQAWTNCQTAMEQTKVVETLGKLNMLGGFAPVEKLKQDAAKAQPKDITPANTKQLERLDEKQLLEMADLDGLDSLEPVPVERRPRVDEDGVIEGEIDNEST